MQALHASLKPGIWGVIIGSILTMIVGFSWGGWTTSSTARQQAMIQADTAVTTALARARCSTTVNRANVANTRARSAGVSGPRTVASQPLAGPRPTTPLSSIG